MCRVHVAASQITAVGMTVGINQPHRDTTPALGAISKGDEVLKEGRQIKTLKSSGSGVASGCIGCEALPSLAATGLTLGVIRQRGRGNE